MSHARPQLFIWSVVPPRVSRGAFNHVSTGWGAPVTHIWETGFSESRKQIGWDAGSFGTAKIEILADRPAADAFVTEALTADPEAIHVFGGFYGKLLSRLDEYISSVDSPRAAVVSERPGAYGPAPVRTLKRAYVPLRQRWLRRRYEASVSAYLPLGGRGVEAAVRAGWPVAKVFPFMYCPELAPIATERTNLGNGSALRALYVGRFSRYTKGVDTLMEAAELLPQQGWSLDLVGGYGDLADETIAWAHAGTNRRFLGGWPANEIGNRMQEYDICIIPSRFDGWNVVVNEALHAGLAVITTDQSVSHEMVVASDAGVVVPADDPIALARAIQQAIDRPNEVLQQKARARKYAPRFSSSAVGDYLISILDYTFRLTADPPRPRCPWL